MKRIILGLRYDSDAAEEVFRFSALDIQTEVSFEETLYVTSNFNLFIVRRGVDGEDIDLYAVDKLEARDWLSKGRAPEEAYDAAGIEIADA